MEASLRNSATRPCGNYVSDGKVEISVLPPIIGMTAENNYIDVESWEELLVGKNDDFEEMFADNRNDDLSSGEYCV